MQAVFQSQLCVNREGRNSVEVLKEVGITVPKTKEVTSRDGSVTLIPILPAQSLHILWFWELPFLHPSIWKIMSFMGFGSRLAYHRGNCFCKFLSETSKSVITTTFTLIRSRSKWGLSTTTGGRSWFPTKWYLLHVTMTHTIKIWCFVTYNCLSDWTAIVVHAQRTWKMSSIHVGAQKVL